MVLETPVAVDNKMLLNLTCVFVRLVEPGWLSFLVWSRLKWSEARKRIRVASTVARMVTTPQRARRWLKKFWNHWPLTAWSLYKSTWLLANSYAWRLWRLKRKELSNEQVAEEPGTKRPKSVHRRKSVRSRQRQNMLHQTPWEGLVLWRPFRTNRTSTPRRHMQLTILWFRVAGFRKSNRAAARSWSLVAALLRLWQCFGICFVMFFWDFFVCLIHTMVWRSQAELHCTNRVTRK